MVARLSGGNQQKIVVARELDRAPAVLVAHQAAWGLDPGATRFVLDRVIALRDAGAAVLYISSELDEVLAISDRIAVMAGGGFAGVVARAEADLRQIGLWMAGTRGMTDAGLIAADRGDTGRAVPAPLPRSGWPADRARRRRSRCSAPPRSIALSGHNPLAAFAAMASGAVGSPHQIGVALNRTTPYLLAGAGVAMCFRAGIINIGAEGQIAVGGIGAAAVALAWPSGPPVLLIGRRCSVRRAAGAAWAGVATAIHLGPARARGAGDVAAELRRAAAGAAGPGRAARTVRRRLPAIARAAAARRGCRHAGDRRACRLLIAIVAAAALSFLLWRTGFGFALRVAGSSRPAAAYAGFSLPRLTWSVMLLAGALAGLAGGIEVLGVHHRLIEGFSLGFGFKAVTVALLGALEPLAIVPAALFVGLLEAGSLSMQRQIGVPSALVAVIEGLTMLFVLAATVRRA